MRAQLKALLPSTQFIMVTVYEDPDRIFRALRAGASGYILKRSTPAHVLEAIRDVLQGGVPLSGGRVLWLSGKATARRVNGNSESATEAGV